MRWESSVHKVILPLCLVLQFVSMSGVSSSWALKRKEDTSYSWSANIIGRKRWRLFPPHAKAHLRREESVDQTSG